MFHGKSTISMVIFNCCFGITRGYVLGMTIHELGISVRRRFVEFDPLPSREYVHLPSGNWIFISIAMENHNVCYGKSQCLLWKITMFDIIYIYNIYIYIIYKSSISVHFPQQIMSNYQRVRIIIFSFLPPSYPHYTNMFDGESPLLMLGNHHIDHEQWGLTISSPLKITAYIPTSSNIHGLSTNSKL